ncbi:hypothetical protein H4R33_006223 [Dimargaris cristalligena]|uniref:Uncharacterized protein n=1 Tax=Dimargaris cristalligena TaxID=215637 RepID=A0A4P9ZWJ0_9FUNG|nr:hypothetical protein H4R33_006223 [Dimargaris cristalligena]RKP37987.1 hypothetical protein BJ085DRAFT_33589 [Dimargaris cristalligena]|eukprot:RKP37987.1 hypothetical protein BJ085DRAFT_33589 [Dimargaris cristalligena]
MTIAVSGLIFVLASLVGPILAAFMQVPTQHYPHNTVLPPPTIDPTPPSSFNTPLSTIFSTLHSLSPPRMLRQFQADYQHGKDLYTQELINNGFEYDDRSRRQQLFSYNENRYGDRKERGEVAGWRPDQGEGLPVGLKTFNVLKHLAPSIKAPGPRLINYSRDEEIDSEDGENGPNMGPNYMGRGLDS